METTQQKPWDENAKEPRPAQPGLRSRISMVLLVIILLFFGYGIFERTRLVADLAKERAAVESLTALGGKTMEADTQDWRALFSPDRPEQGVRVGYVELPEVGPAPGYSQKVTEILQQLTFCQQVRVQQDPPKKVEKKKEPSEGESKNSTEENEGDNSEGDKADSDKTEGEKPEGDNANGDKDKESPAASATESLDVEELKKQFPKVVFYLVPSIPKGEARAPMGS
jgi:hypothetical protein